VSLLNFEAGSLRLVKTDEHYKSDASEEASTAAPIKDEHDSEDEEFSVSKRKGKGRAAASKYMMSERCLVFTSWIRETEAQIDYKTQLRQRTLLLVEAACRVVDYGKRSVYWTRVKLIL